MGRLLQEGKCYVTCQSRRRATNAWSITPIAPTAASQLPTTLISLINSASIFFSHSQSSLLLPVGCTCMADYSNHNRGQEDEEDEEDIDETVLHFILWRLNRHGLMTDRATKPSKMLFSSLSMSARPCSLNPLNKSLKRLIVILLPLLPSNAPTL